MDDMAEYAEQLNDAIDNAVSIDLKLGLATVRVEYLMVTGCPLVQGATVNGEWTDADCFARHVTAGWRRDIERTLRAVPRNREPLDGMLVVDCPEAS